MREQADKVLAALASSKSGADLQRRSKPTKKGDQAFEVGRRRDEVKEKMRQAMRVMRGPSRSDKSEFQVADLDTLEKTVRRS